MTVQLNSKWLLLLSTSYTAKYEMAFVLKLENASLQRFCFKVNRKILGSSKNGTRISKIVLCLRDRHVFIWQSLAILKVFNTLLTLKQVFWKTKTLLKKFEYRFSVQSTTNDSATFPYRTALSKSSVKINWMGSTKWTYHKEQTFATGRTFFWKFNLSIRIFYK